MIPVSSDRFYRIDVDPCVGASFRIGHQLYTITAFDMKTNCSGRLATIPTLGSACTIFGAPFTFEATKSRISPLRTCREHRGKRPKAIPKSISTKPDPPVLRPPNLKMPNDVGRTLKSTA